MIASMLLALMSTQSPTVHITADNTIIDRSCIVVIDASKPIADGDDDGVIHVAADDITIEFAEKSELRGCDRNLAPNQMRGVGIRLDGHKNVTIRNARVHGFKVGFSASDCDGLKIEGGDFSDNFRQRLHSTPEAEDEADWMSFHQNENDEAVRQYGAAVSIKRAKNVDVHDVRVRRGQNGIVLSRVERSKIYDNDCSFLSGWGLATWRSSENVVSRNRFDFCIRGHSEGVYNRGQDSAGIIAFEQCSRNVFAENSVTHGGDGFFSFAGVEALNGEGAPKDFNFKRAGCNDNVLIDNDFSYAAAHGVEITFSFGNKLIRNRIVENAICGFWGGFSQETLVAENTFERNGGMAYGSERGAINIDHSAENTIVKNTFLNNRCGVYIWWYLALDLERGPWGKANCRSADNNVIAGNTFELNDDAPFPGDAKMIVLELRDFPQLPEGFGRTTFANNQVNVRTKRGVEFDITPTIRVERDATTPTYETPKYSVFGRNHPVGAHPQLSGRDKIIMGEWGPWDHESPMFRARSTSGARHVYEIFQAREVKFDHPMATLLDMGDRTQMVVATDRGVMPYRFPVTVDGERFEAAGTLIAAEWNVTTFSWDDETSPLNNLEAWRARGTSDAAVSTNRSSIDFKYGYRGPKQMKWSDDVTKRGPGPDHFGTIARTTIDLPKGSWKLSTLSDDGVRVLVDGKPIIEHWDHHGPQRDTATFAQPRDGRVELVVEHFEIDGYSVLTFDLEPAD